jgi:hypothetical protein
VSEEMVSVLWLCGPPELARPGWEVYCQLIRSGIKTGYVDVDQLDICYPELASDPGRHWMKARHRSIGD